MKKWEKRAVVGPFVLVLLVLSCIAGKAADRPPPDNDLNRALQKVEFSSPKKESLRNYLGLSDASSFTVAPNQCPGSIY